MREVLLVKNGSSKRHWNEEEQHYEEAAACDNAKSFWTVNKLKKQTQIRSLQIAACTIQSHTVCCVIAVLLVIL
jgi:hypothetical protein